MSLSKGLMPVIDQQPLPANRSLGVASSIPYHGRSIKFEKGGSGGSLGILIAAVIAVAVIIIAFIIVILAITHVLPTGGYHPPVIV